MFVQILVKDTIKVLPAHFGKKYTDALIEAIHAKYANKVRAIAIAIGIPIQIVSNASTGPNHRIAYHFETI